MTERLYYTDSYCSEIDAQVVRIEQRNGRQAITLDRSIFYPTSGGQPNDTGTLNGYGVEDVLVDEAGAIWHLLAAGTPPFATEQTVHGVIDWQRRFDHMQQHSGQHLLSQVFVRLFAYETVSVHFGALYSTLDLDVETVSLAQLEEAERYANELAYSARPIRAYFVDEAQLPTLLLRRPPKVTGVIRIVEIENFDWSACGGTHCRTTAEFLPIKLTQIERKRGQCRLTFLCGQRASDDYAQKHRLLSLIANMLSTDAGQAPARIEQLLSQTKQQQQTLQKLTAQLLAYQAANLLEQARQAGELRLVVYASDEYDIAALRTLATSIAEAEQTVGFLASTVGEKSSLLFVRGKGVGIHMGHLLRSVLQTVNGAGGGRPELAQGGVAKEIELSKLLEEAVRQLGRT